MLQRLATSLRFRLVARQSKIERQAGAIPYVVVDGQIAVLLITSRSGRWILPKGRLISGLQPHETALREAREEAGIEGVVSDKPLGRWRTLKWRGVRLLPLEVDLYPMRVTQQFDAWEEQSERKRHWAGLREAQRVLSDSRLADIAMKLKELD
jgi:8-oxo-dGTP pyrophosphatase MutT (NUDIX family)